MSSLAFEHQIAEIILSNHSRSTNIRHESHGNRWPCGPFRVCCHPRQATFRSPIESPDTTRGADTLLLKLRACKDSEQLLDEASITLVTFFEEDALCVHTRVPETCPFAAVPTFCSSHARLPWKTFRGEDVSPHPKMAPSSLLLGCLSGSYIYNRQLLLLRLPYPHTPYFWPRSFRRAGLQDQL